MSTLLHLLSWVPLERAATSLSIILKEPVEAADLLRMGIERRLVLSLHLVNEAYARQMNVVELPKARVATVDVGDGRGDVAVPLGMRLPGSSKVLEEGGEVALIRDIWDIVPVGAGLVELERQYQAHVSGPAVEVLDLCGVFVRRRESYWRLIDPPPGHAATAAQRAAIADRPAHLVEGGFPRDAAVVVRTKELARLVDHAAAYDEKGHRRELADRERTTLLNIIGALVDLLVMKPGTGSRPNFKNDSQLIDWLTESYPDATGIKRSTLAQKLNDGRMSLKGSRNSR